MRGRDIVGLVLLGVILTIAVGGYVAFEMNKDEQLTTQVSTDSFQAVPKQSQNAAPASLQPTGGPASSSSLLVQGAQSPTRQAQTPALPGPDQFGQYEQYAKNENLLYVDEVVGQGLEAKSGNRVAMLYKGWLTDGTIFDQSGVNEEGQVQPFVFQIGQRQVIQGWDQGIIGMKVGGKRRLVIPSAFGYGETGQGPIPPNAMLIFDVELVGVE